MQDLGVTNSEEFSHTEAVCRNRNPQLYPTSLMAAGPTILAGLLWGSAVWGYDLATISPMFFHALETLLSLSSHV